MIFGENANAHQRAGERDPGARRELPELLLGIKTAAAVVDDGLAGVLDGAKDRDELGELGQGGETADVTGDGHRNVPFRNSQLLLNILGNINKDGAGTTGTSEEEGFLHNTGDVSDVQDEVIVLGNGTGHFNNWRLLKTIRTNHTARDLASNSNKGNRVHHSICETSDQVGSTGAGSGNAHTDLARGFSETFSGENLTLLVTTENISNLVGPSKGLVNLHRCTTGISEHGIYPFTLKALD
mmetsp:Transcript_9198/g.17272  ORF Transcript_9198/g.17272 Transcript_9198/m.17272 type:complete len:240 (-) Transcript_9198:324-1043(-)